MKSDQLRKVKKKTNQNMKVKKKCLGCGIFLTSDANTAGYTPVLEKASLCQRCFQLKHYQKTTVDPEISRPNVQQTLKNFQFAKNALFYACDLTMLPYVVDEIKRLKNLTKVFYLIITKIDMMISTKNFQPKDERLFAYTACFQLDLTPEQIIFTSAKLNLNYVKLQNAIFAVSKQKLKICFVGLTNSGKSSLINWILDREKISQQRLTTSPYLNTTQGLKQIKTRNFTLIDVPGTEHENSFQFLMNDEQLKKIVANKKNRPRTYQINDDQLFIAENLFWCEVIKNDDSCASVTFYLSHQLTLHRTSLKNKNRFENNPKTLFPISNLIFQDKYKQYLFNSNQKIFFIVLYGLGIVVFKGIKKVIWKLPEKIIGPHFVEGAKF